MPVFWLSAPLNAFANDQCRGVGARDSLHQAEHILHALAFHNSAANNVALILRLRGPDLVLGVL